MQVSGVEKKLWKQQPTCACNGAMSSWDAGVNVTGDSGLFCGLQADAGAGPAPRLPAQSPPAPINSLMHSPPPKKEQASVYVVFQETVSAANLRASFTKTLKISTLANNRGAFSFL